MRAWPSVGFAGTMFFLSLAATAADPGGNSAAPPGSARAVRIGTAVEIPANKGGIVLEVGKGTLIRLARPAATVFVADPDIADVQVKSPSVVYVSAKSPGETVIYAVDASDSVLLNAPIRVELDVSPLRRALAQQLPGAQISVASVGGNFVLSGAVASAGQAEKARTLTASIAAGVKGAQVINRVTVATPDQVNLQVKIAEVDRDVLKEIGVDWSKIGSPMVAPGPAVSFGTVNNPTPLTTPLSVNTLFVGMFPSLTGQQISAEIEALATENYITILAEPNLTAVSGQTASFLAGGEFPIPVVQSVSAGAPTITVEYKEYGVQLAFTPTVIDGNHLSMRVRPEVSELSTQGEVTISGFVIPALTVRRAETTVELGSGQTFALAGLLDTTSEQDISKIPWLGDIPILGALFRSNKFQHNESELVILVTPYLVRPGNTPLTTPLAGLQFPNDAQQVLWSDTYRQKLPGPPQGPVGPSGQGLIGPAGFRLN